MVDDIDGPSPFNGTPQTRPSLMMTPPSFAEIEVEGADAATFLHSQLANDVRGIDLGQWRFGSYCAPDGRVQAVMMIARHGLERWRLLLPADLAPGVALRLQRYRLRARCTISSNRVGLGSTDAAPMASARYQCAAFTLATSTGSEAPMPPGLWSQQLELGIPWIVAATSERFLPQMLALERLQAFSLRKGCFPGQEVVARTHFLGRVKRRLVHLRLEPGSAPLDAGAELCLEKGAPVSATVLLSAGSVPTQTLAVVANELLPGAVLHPMNPAECATYVIDRDVIETISDDVLNGLYLPPVDA